MLAKVIKLSNERGGDVGSRDLVEYLARDENEEARDVTDYAARDRDGVPRNQLVEGGTFNLEGLGVSDPMDRDLAVRMIDYVSSAGRQKTHFKTNPIYHFALSWPEGEHPDLRAVNDAVAHSLKALGMQENQALFVVHRDKAHHDHVHVIVNRVHPEKLTLSGPPRFDYLILDKACREIEVAQGWRHDNGPHVVVDGEIKRLTKAQRKAMELIAEERSDHAATPSARMFEIHNGTASFATWAREHIASELVATINRPGASWESLHSAMAKHGIKMELRGGGLVLVTKAMDRETSTKASGVDYRLSLGRLQKVLGPYRPATQLVVKADTSKTYVHYINRVMTGEGESRDRTGGKSQQREAKRIERKTARDALVQRYKTEKTNSKEKSKLARSALKQYQDESKRSLREELKQIKPSRISELTQQYGSRQIASAVWAAEKAVAQQNLQAAQKLERAELAKSLNMDWPAWLERQAAAGDESAQAALRGIRYREGRSRSKSRPGFEGEELDQIPAQKSQYSGAIGGHVGPFRLNNASIDVDQAHQRVLYRDSDGKARLVDSGPRIDVLERNDNEAIRAGLELAAEKFGGEVYITGDPEFRERAAREAARMHIKVADPDLQLIVENERQRVKQDPLRFLER